MHRVCRSAASKGHSRWLAWTACAFLLTSPAAAQPSAEGAVSELEDKPKSTLPLPMTTRCAVTAHDLSIGHDCAGLLDCSTGQSCGGEGGLDHVAAGTGLRNRGEGVIELAGAPPGAVAVGAWLYWGVIAEDEGVLATALLDDQPLEGELLGVTPGPCWSAILGTEPPTFRAYRKPVLELVRPGINGNYRVAVPGAPVTDGRDPWRWPPVASPWVDGVSLLVVYRHPEVPYEAAFTLHEGPALLQGSLALEHELPAVGASLASPQALRHTRIGGDGQRHAGYSPTYPFATTLLWDDVSCSHLSPLQIAGPGSPVDPVSDWKGRDGGSVTQLWDTQLTELAWPHDVAGCADYLIDYSSLTSAGEDPGTGESLGFFYDCVVVVAHALTVR
ncbi:MAG: hypothetical protein AAF560_05825 [Acidobacteriota bacterium]